MSIECSKTAKKQGTLNMFSFKPLTREEQVVKKPPCAVYHELP